MTDIKNFKPAPGSADFEAQFARWGDDVRIAQYVGVIICTVAPTLAVALRLYARHLYRTRFGLDDLFIIVALLCVYAETVASCLSFRDGAGLHQVRVLYEDKNAPNGLVNIYTNYWIVSVMWAPGVMFIKMSILILYRRLFLVQQRWFKIALWANMFYAVGLGISGMFVFIFQCWPVQYYWTRTIQYYGVTPPEGTCIPLIAHLATPQFLNTASDIAILILPLPIIWKLEIQNARKVAISGVFLLGCFTVGCGLARIVVIFKVTNTYDVTWNNLDTVTFTVVEAGVGIVCACLPPIAPLYASIMQKWGLMASEPEYYGKGSVYQAPPPPVQPRPQHHRKPSRILSITSSLGDDKNDVEFQNLVPEPRSSDPPQYSDPNLPEFTMVGKAGTDTKRSSEAWASEPERPSMCSTALPTVRESRNDEGNGHAFEHMVPEYMEMDHSGQRQSWR